MNNQECKIRTEIINLNTNETLLYPYSIKIITAKTVVIESICVPDDLKNKNVKVFNLMSRTNETRQRWNEDKCRCECKELIDKGICDKGFIWNPSNCECECDKSCDVGEYLDYKNCKCSKKKKLIN